MVTLIAWVLFLIPAILVAGQLISVINFPLAQRLGLQENPAYSDPLWQQVEFNTALWDLVSMIWLPVAGLLMLLNHDLWPVPALIGGGIYFDTGGRELAKSMGLRAEGVQTGTDRDIRLHIGTCITMSILGITAIVLALGTLSESLAM